MVSRFQFRELFEKSACAVAQPDLCHCGGLWEAHKIAALAETDHVGIAPHNPLGPIATAVALHFAFATPNFLIQEAIRRDVPWRDDVLTEPLPIVGGYAHPPPKPGLGVAVNEREAQKHPFEQEILMRSFHDDGAVADW